MLDPTQITVAYPAELRPSEWEDLGSAGGFSGANFWRLLTPSGAMCLRRWPTEHPTSTRLDYIHGVLQHVGRAGVQIVPLPMLSRDGCSYVRMGGFLWEMSPWMPGRADYWLAPSRIRLDAAMQTLGRFHQAAASFAGGGSAAGIAPGIPQRAKLLDDLLAGDIHRIRQAVRAHPHTEMTLTATKILELFPQASSQVVSQLAAAHRLVVPIQPCIRDIWHDHVLFTGNRVTGLIDFGAMQNDSVATDLSRLLGSLASDNIPDWQHGLEAYQSVRRLSRQESELIGILDSSTILLSGMNWLRWVYLEGRKFADMASVATRLRGIAARLNVLVSRSGGSVLDSLGANVSSPRIIP